MNTTEKLLGCIDKADYGNAHQLQLWIEKGASGWQWILRNAYVPGGKLIRSGELDRGSGTDYEETRRLGQETFDRVKAEELAKFPATPAS